MSDAGLPLNKKPSVVIVYTGEGKGKTTAGLGLLCRALGHGDRVAFIQFIKSWEVNEDIFLQKIAPTLGGRLTTHKGGLGFYNAGQMSAAGISDQQHKTAARKTFNLALRCSRSGKYDVVICDEINNAVHERLLREADLAHLIASRNIATSLCLTGRNFPKNLYDAADILTNMTPVRHHYNEGFMAHEGIDF